MTNCQHEVFQFQLWDQFCNLSACIKMLHLNTNVTNVSIDIFIVSYEQKCFTSPVISIMCRVLPR